jgi:hypothetical protein
MIRRDAVRNAVMKQEVGRGTMQTGVEIMTNEQMQLIIGLVYDIVMKARTLEEAQETLARYVQREDK